MRPIPFRRLRRLLVVLPLLGLTVACGGRATTALGVPHVPSAPIAATTSAAPKPLPKSHAPKRKHPKIDALRTAAASVDPGTTLGAVVYDRTTGRSPLAYNADRSFRSASLVKLLIAIDLLQRGADALDRKQIHRMLMMSDDKLASMFWVRDGGPALVTRTSAKLGLTGVRPPEVSGQWGEVVVTPRDIVTVYRYVLGLPPEDRRLIVDALAQAPRVAADGFDQHFGIPDGIDADWAVKQGWGSDDRARVLHSTGLVGPHWRYVMVLLSEHPLGTGWQTCARSVTAAARAMDGTLPGI